MLAVIEPYLSQVGVRQLGWLILEGWRDDWLTNMGFTRVNWITTFINDRVSETPSGASRMSKVAVRQATREDISVLVGIEELAFGPLWRHSVSGLTEALDHSLCFDVALIENKIVGFQYSVTGSHWDSAHLVRITVDPGVQQSGVGSALLTSAFDHYRHKGLQLVTLNTQVDNAASQRLYEKFGFRVIGNQIPMWSKAL
jgi:ribosomal protein S18 acetylase RimI-like enzyme